MIEPFEYFDFPWYIAPGGVGEDVISVMTSNDITVLRVPLRDRRQLMNLRRIVAAVNATRYRSTESLEESANGQPERPIRLRRTTRLPRTVGSCPS